MTRHARTHITHTYSLFIAKEKEFRINCYHSNNKAESCADEKKIKAREGIECVDDCFDKAYCVRYTLILTHTFDHEVAC